MRHSLFSQTYTNGDQSVTCWWGISGESMSFLVIDATSSATTEATFNMTTYQGAPRGILECGRAIRCLDVTGTVVHLTEDYIGGTRLPMSAAELMAYLRSDKYPLTLSGAKAYFRDCQSGSRWPQSQFQGLDDEGLRTPRTPIGDISRRPAGTADNTPLRGL